MRNPVAHLLPFFLLSACSPVTTHIDNDRTTLSIPTMVRTKVTFEPLDREQAQRYLEAERATFKQNTDPMVRRKEALERGREERYREIRHEFPECDRQAHCMAHVSKGDVKRFERFNDLTKEIHQYDSELVELDTALRDWRERLELRTRAILNRFVVHEVMQLPTIEKRFQGILAYSLESFETRRAASVRILRFTGADDLEPRVLGDYDFRMLGRPIDEAAVIATFEVYLTTPLNEFRQPTRYVVSMLVNTHQLDLRYYDRDFLHSWAEKMIEPFQEALRQDVYCGVYSIAGDTLAPRFDKGRPKKCAERRSLMRKLDASRFPDRFPPDRWMVPIAYYPMDQADKSKLIDH